METPLAPYKLISLFYTELYTQYKIATNCSLREAKNSTGLFLLYMWALANENNDVKQKLKEEASVLFKDVGNFFEMAKNDFVNLNVEKPEIVLALKAINEREYNNLINLIQSDDF